MSVPFRSLLRRTRGHVRPSVLAYFFCAVLAGCSPMSADKACQNVLDGVEQVIVVMTDDWHVADATIAMFQKTGSHDTPRWEKAGQSIAAVVGRAGLGWGNGFEGLRTRDEPIKQEGDGRTPAGTFLLGPSFGFTNDPRPGHLALEPGTHICVDDLRSPYYGEIHSRERVGETTRGEDMGTIPVYKEGIVIRYPPDRQKKSGSCIFFHIWEAPGAGTAGCVAMPEDYVVRLQSFGEGGKTAVVIWPKTASARLASCLPNLARDVIINAVPDPETGNK